MKTKTTLLLFATTFLFVSCKSSSSLSYSPSPMSSAVCIQLASDGSCIVEVCELGSNIGIATNAALKNAVYRLLFNGIQGKSENRIQNIIPLVSDDNARNANQNYFNVFFKDGSYRSYAEVLSGTVPSVAKTTSGYKVTATVVLKKEQLRKKLEKDNIIKSLSNVN